MSVSITSWDDWDRRERPAPDPNPPMKCRWCGDRSFLEDFKTNGIWHVYRKDSRKQPSLENICPDCVDYIEEELLPVYKRKVQNASITSFSKQNRQTEENQ